MCIPPIFSFLYSHIIYAPTVLLQQLDVLWTILGGNLDLVVKLHIITRHEYFTGAAFLSVKCSLLFHYIFHNDYLSVLWSLSMSPLLSDKLWLSVSDRQVCMKTEILWDHPHSWAVCQSMRHSHLH